jgi:chemotaxis protein methyltransferase CheR
MLTEYVLSDADFTAISSLINEAAGITLQPSKKTLVYSRLVKRLRATGVDNFTSYRKLLEHDRAELTHMVEALTTNTTSFYREPHHFQHLEGYLRTQILPAARAGAPVRIWSAACSSGEEPYSTALTVLSAFASVPAADVKILATDINTSIVEKAKRGIYSAAAAERVPLSALKSHFDPVHDQPEPAFSIGKRVRELVHFRTLNLQGAWPMKNAFDVIFCRNVMIYFSQETQSQLWQRFANVLKPGGILYIGHSERVAGPATALLQNIGPTTYLRQTGGRS